MLTDMILLLFFQLTLSLPWLCELASAALYTPQDHTALSTSPKPPRRLSHPLACLRVLN